MAITNVTIRDLRPCIVRDRRGEIKKGLFHTWSQESKPVAPSYLVGGHSGGVVSFILGLVELEDGTVEKEYPEDITFLDSPDKFKEYDFTYEKEKENDTT